jgi:hypothetical protein
VQPNERFVYEEVTQPCCGRSASNDRTSSGEHPPSYSPSEAAAYVVEPIPRNVSQQSSLLTMKSADVHPVGEVVRRTRPGAAASIVRATFTRSSSPPWI